MFCASAGTSLRPFQWLGHKNPLDLGGTSWCLRVSPYYRHIIQTSLDGEWVDGGEFPLSLGSYATIPKAPRGGSINWEDSFFLDVVHVDIAFGDCVSMGGFRYALIFVNWATRYNWVFGLKDAAGRQSSNGLVESHWKIMVHMARAYLTEKQMPRPFWFYAISHSARMMNAIPGKFGGKLASPFLLAHGLGHEDERTWFPLFSVCYFHCDREGEVSRSHCQAHTMDGIPIGRSPTSNAMLVYSPQTKRYYKPDSYRLDPYRLPTSVYPDLPYDGGLFCSLVRDGGAPMEEPYPPGTRVKQIDPTSKLLLAGTVMDIPLSADAMGTPSYLVLFDNGTSASIPLPEMPSILPFL